MSPPIDSSHEPLKPGAVHEVQSPTGHAAGPEGGAGHHGARGRIGARQGLDIMVTWDIGSLANIKRSRSLRVVRKMETTLRKTKWI